MNRLINWLLFISVNCFVSSDGAISACNENTSTFNQCLENALNTIIPTLKQDGTRLDAPSIDPFHLPSVNTTHTDNETMDVSLATWNVVITGLSDSRVHAVKTQNLYMGKLEVVLKVPEIQVVGDYETEGFMATFPLSSEGHFNVTMDDVTIVNIIYLERYSLGQEGRLLVRSLSLDLVPGQIHILPAQSFDGDPKLGKILEGYLNENSYELYKMVKDSLMKYLSSIAKIMINTFISQVPDDRLITSLNIL